MSLTFGAGGSNRVGVSANASHNTYTSLTVIGWFYPTNESVFNRFWQKENAATGSRANLKRNDFAPTRVEANIFRSGGSAVEETDDVVPNVWQCIAFTADEAASGQCIRIYRGTLTAGMAEVTYAGVSTDGSGTFGTVDGTFWVGNRNATDRGFGGNVANIAFFKNRVLTVGEMTDWQFRPRKLNADCGFMLNLGWQGTSSVADLSGNANTATVTGATQSAHVPLGPAFGRDSYIHRAAAAAATFNAAWNGAANTAYQPGAMAA